MNDATVLRFPDTTPSAVSPSLLLADEHPAHRLAEHGASVLSDAELVTLLTRTRLRTVGDLAPARAMLRDGLAALVRQSAAQTHHLRRRDAIRIAAAIEFGRRALNAESISDRQPIDTDRFARTLIHRYAHHVQEHLGVAFLDSRDRLLGTREVFMGTLQSAVVSTRDIVRIALEHHAAAIIVYHNHPSGDPSPSEEDHAFTTRLDSAASLLDVKLLDHIVIGASRYVSFRQRGYL